MASIINVSRLCFIYWMKCYIYVPQPGLKEGDDATPQAGAHNKEQFSHPDFCLGFRQLQHFAKLHEKIGVKHIMSCGWNRFHSFKPKP